METYLSLFTLRTPHPQFLHMWQSWVKSESYSIAHFDHIIAFEAL